MDAKPVLKCNSCGNGDQETSQRVPGFYALTKVEKDENGSAVFSPANGMPVVVYICLKCGEIKLFPAILLGEF